MSECSNIRIFETIFKCSNDKMTETMAGHREFDLEERTLKFARAVRTLVRKLPKNTALVEDCRQLVRSSGSVGANYIEANESLSKKDFAMRIKICRKESKESRYWLSLIQDECPDGLLGLCRELYQEAHELMSIFGAIVRKLEAGKNSR